MSNALYEALDRMTEEILALQKDLALNASMLAKQTDLARDAETECHKAQREAEQLRKDALIMALRLYGEDPDTFSPECYEVMKRWDAKIKETIGWKP